MDWRPIGFLGLLVLILLVVWLVLRGALPSPSTDPRTLEIRVNRLERELDDLERRVRWLEKGRFVPPEVEIPREPTWEGRTGYL